MPTQDSTSLYERLYSIATVMEDFVDRLMADLRLKANQRVDEAHHRVSPAGFKYLVPIAKGTGTQAHVHGKQERANF